MSSMSRRWKYAIHVFLSLYYILSKLSLYTPNTPNILLFLEVEDVTCELNVAVTVL